MKGLKLKPNSLTFKIFTFSALKMREINIVEILNPKKFSRLRRNFSNSVISKLSIHFRPYFLIAIFGLPGSRIQGSSDCVALQCFHGQIKIILYMAFYRTLLQDAVVRAPPLRPRVPPGAV